MHARNPQVEPTESEDKQELDRFVDALIGIRKEIEKVASGEFHATVRSQLSDAYRFGRLESCGTHALHCSRPLTGRTPLPCP